MANTAWGIIELDSCEGTCGRATVTATNFWWGLSNAAATAAHKRTLTGFECIWEVSIHEGLQVALANLHVIKERSLGLGRGGCALQVPFLLNFAFWKTFSNRKFKQKFWLNIAGCFGNSWTKRKFFTESVTEDAQFESFLTGKKKNTPWQPLTVDLED